MNKNDSRHLFSRTGFTLVELLVVITIIGVLLAIAIPVVQAVRESARATTCQNHLREIGVGLISYQSTFGRFPANGWGYRWHAEPSNRGGLGQPGSWIYQILGQIEQDGLMQIGTQASSAGELQFTLGELCQSPIALLNCPTRRSAEPLPYTESYFLPYNCIVPDSAAKTDYAINAGHEIVDGKAGPESIEDYYAYDWPDLDKATGISFSIMSVSPNKIRDGLSNTMLVAEKYLPRGSYTKCTSRGDDQTMYIGDDADNRRWTYASPRQDGSEDDIQGFGSAHRRGLNGLFCDGSTRVVAFGIADSIFQSMGHRNDGSPTSID